MSLADAISTLISQHRPDLRSKYHEIYKHLHANPELSFREYETTQLLQSHLKKYQDPAFDIKPDIGGTGFAAVLENGSGPIVALRADMDALPIREQTDLPYASQKSAQSDMFDQKHPAMHACGHDFHMTSILAAAELLHGAKDSWSGTLILLLQPAEEKGMGAQAMVDDGLYTKHGVPKPEIVLGGHVMPYRAGVVGTRRKIMASSADSLKITLHGRGGHASQPHRTVDPIVLASNIVNRLQTLVSRETNPADHAVITVASLRAGEAENIIPETAELKVDMRAFDDKVRQRLLDGIRRVVDGEVAISQSPKKAEYETIRHFPITYNDDHVTEKLEETFRAHFGKDGAGPYDDNIERLLGSEDYSILATSIDKPCSFFVYGGTDPDKWDRAEQEGKLSENIPINHSAYFGPTIEPTLTRGVDAYAVSALTFLKLKGV